MYAERTRCSYYTESAVIKAYVEPRIFSKFACYSDLSQDDANWVSVVFVIVINIE